MYSSSKVGGKASNLLKLTKWKYTVPPGFILSTDFFEEVMAHTPLSSILKKITLKDQTKIVRFVAQIRNIILSTPFPRPMQHEVYTIFDALRLDRVSVRSSSTVEDGLCHSFAGYFETYLHVKRSEIIKRIIDCWIATYSERVVKYVTRTEIPIGTVKPALIIQRMIVPDKAGVIFTRNVYTGNRNELIIESCDGLGNQVVDAEVEPSRYIVQKNTKNIIRSTIGFPAIGLLHLSQIHRLVHEALSIESRFRYPQDIEWALVNDTPYILQARPIAHMHNSSYY